MIIILGMARNSRTQLCCFARDAIRRNSERVVICEEIKVSSLSLRLARNI